MAEVCPPPAVAPPSAPPFAAADAAPMWQPRQHGVGVAAAASAGLTPIGVHVCHGADTPAFKKDVAGCGGAGAADVTAAAADQACALEAPPTPLPSAARELEASPPSTPDADGGVFVNGSGTDDSLVGCAAPADDCGAAAAAAAAAAMPASPFASPAAFGPAGGGAGGLLDEDADTVADQLAPPAAAPLARQRSILKRGSGGDGGGGGGGGGGGAVADAGGVRPLRSVSWSDAGGQAELAEVHEFEPR